MARGAWQACCFSSSFICCCCHLLPGDVCINHAGQPRLLPLAQHIAKQGQCPGPCSGIRHAILGKTSRLLMCCAGPLLEITWVAPGMPAATCSTLHRYVSLGPQAQRGSSKRQKPQQPARTFSQDHYMLSAAPANASIHHLYCCRHQVGGAP
jgi:hypothetical protein